MSRDQFPKKFFKRLYLRLTEFDDNAILRVKWFYLDGDPDSEPDYGCYIIAKDKDGVTRESSESSNEGSWREDGNGGGWEMTVEDELMERCDKLIQSGQATPLYDVS